MKILYISQYFPPEMGAPAARASELTRYWSQMGHDVAVLTGFPNHPTGVVPPEWRPRLRRLIYHEKVANVDVYRTWLWPRPNRKAHERMLNYASFCLSAALRGLALPRPDVIIASSPQLLVGLSGWWLAFTRQIPFVFEVRDLWPESLAAVGVGNEDSLLHHALARIAGFLYREAARIVVVTPAFKDYLVAHWRVPPDRIDVVENGVETDLFHPTVETELRTQFCTPAQFLVCYVGTMGMAHGLETVLDAAAELQQNNSAVHFLLIGEGAEKERSQAQAKSRGLKHVQFLDQQPRERIPALISAADACLVLLKKSDIFKTVIPTKMLEFMACARPVILGVDGLARQIVEHADCGIVIEPENPRALSEAICQLESDRQLGRIQGEQGRKFVRENFSRVSTAEHYIEVLKHTVSSAH